MPYVNLHTSEPIPQAKQTQMVKAISQFTAGAIGKPEGYMMVTLSHGTVCLGGVVAPGAFADVRSIGGLNGKVNGQIAAKMCALLEAELGIPGNRVYLNFTNVGPSEWGWNASTFG